VVVLFYSTPVQWIRGNRLELEVVPDSGSDQLAGLVGKMAIRIEDGQHYYEFNYELADRRK